MLVNRRTLLALSPACTSSYVTSKPKQSLKSHVIQHVQDPNLGYCILDARELLPSVDPDILFDSIIRPYPIRVYSSTVHCKSIVTPYADELFTFYTWMNDLGTTIIQQSNEQKRAIDTVVHVRCTSFTSKTVARKKKLKEVEKWHIDGSYITCVMCLKGPGTDIAPQYTELPDRAHETIQSFITLKEGQALIMNGGQRPEHKLTVHRAPTDDETVNTVDRLAIVAFTST